MPETLTTRQLNRATLARQLLLERAPLRVPAAIEHIGGVQAQEPRPPFLGLWSRLEGFAREDLHAALHGRAVVRATLFRGTLHLASAADYVVLRPLLAPVLREGLKALGARAEGLDPGAVLPVARELLEEAPRTFTELRGLLSERFPGVHERALGFAVRMLLPVVMVPTEHRWAFPSAAAFAPAETWLGAPLDPAPDPSALVRRHLAAFGPATVADVQAHTGLGGLKAVVAGMENELVTFADERGRTLFDLPDAPRPDPGVAAPARLLPEFDSLVLAHADRSRVIAEEHRTGLVTKNLRVPATFLWDGVVSGTWTLARTGRKATLTLAPFATLPRGAATPLREEARAVLGFLEDDAAQADVTIR